MARIDRVIEYLEQYAAMGSKGVSAQDVAAKLDIHRSDASADLNRLFKQGKVKKTGSRPVVYQSLAVVANIKTKAWDKKSAFSEIVGYDGSIKAQIELAKAAIVYPPNGLHTLIFGESGVGKNLLAEAMQNYARECWTKTDDEDIPFIQFNCADYAANEQLLIAQLFGYVKGAFTGANEDREGVVDHAQGGILFLDEIHRLPPAGQELLFMLIDKGVYRRLGATRAECKSHLMIIGATSEDISSSLLMTFRRRIPVQISLPRISERPIRERINLIIHFVHQEAIRLGVPVWIEGKALETFANYNCPANIGELRNDVLLCCAKSYLSYIATLAEQLELKSENIPQRVFSLVKHQTVLDDRVNDLFHSGILVEPDGEPIHSEQANPHDFHIDLYGYVDRKLANYQQLGIPAADIAVKVGHDLEKYFGSVAQILRRRETSDMPASIIDEEVWEAANDLLNDAADRLNRSYGRNTLVALAWHLQQFKERITSGRIIYNPNLNHVKTTHKDAFQIVEEHARNISKQLNSKISTDEMGFMAMFLVHGAENLTHLRIGIIIAAHGRGTAQSMAEVANNLLGTDRIKAYDIPLNRNNAQTIEDLQDVVKMTDEGCGVVLLVDMGFLVTMEDALNRETGVQVRIIPNVTTALVLETGRRLFTTDDDIDTAVKRIYEAYEDYVVTLRQKRYQFLSAARKITRKIVLLICASGKGVAEKVKDILLTNIPEVQQMNFIMASAVENIQEIIAQAEGDVCLIVGSSDPQIQDIPFVHIGSLFVDGGMTIIRNLLQQENAAVLDTPVSIRRYEDVYKLLAGQLSKFVKSLPVAEVSSCCERLVEKIDCEFFMGVMEQDGIIRTYLHAACMFDRIHAGEALQDPDWSGKIQRERAKDFQRLRKFVQGCGAKMSLQIPDGELCYFLSSLPAKNEKKQS
ncbi:Transcriptional regulator containing an AAA-type ATPase domain and a DNA-binding domain [Propionispira arboris]|uniref:Transcriptional regulator containing an AAA-type ATPase domain and a DNA-binding domain n=1 Tax=Propionispira arboris TaxID=84035 RepID=A0A1H6XXQ7_9FIRM|nr:sigma 54-interacting transcriptional regulator [Propionispira arboris]SEJ29662.1 Transcriptional regulator containing an AAA-type ATPase domain and a DNA-binding domain [Propionispira arboris]